MKKFDSHRPMKDLKAKVIALKGTWNQEKFDKEGSDYISFLIPDFHGQKDLDVMVNTFNGRFMTKVGDKLVTELDVELEGQKWYDELLDLVYIATKEGN